MLTCPAALCRALNAATMPPGGGALQLLRAGAAAAPAARPPPRRAPPCRATGDAGSQPAGGGQPQGQEQAPPPPPSPYARRRRRSSTLSLAPQRPAGVVAATAARSPPWRGAGDSTAAAGSPAARSTPGRSGAPGVPEQPQEQEQQQQQEQPQQQQPKQQQQQQSQQQRPPPRGVHVARPPVAPPRRPGTAWSPPAALQRLQELCRQPQAWEQQQRQQHEQQYQQQHHPLHGMPLEPAWRQHGTPWAPPRQWDGSAGAAGADGAARAAQQWLAQLPPELGVLPPPGPARVDATALLGWPDMQPELLTRLLGGVLREATQRLLWVSVHQPAGPRGTAVVWLGQPAPLLARAELRPGGGGAVLLELPRRPGLAPATWVEGLSFEPGAGAAAGWFDHLLLVAGEFSGAEHEVMFPNLLTHCGDGRVCFDARSGADVAAFVARADADAVRRHALHLTRIAWDARHGPDWVLRRLEQRWGVPALARLGVDMRYLNGVLLEAGVAPALPPPPHGG
ncbi:hypothetical protein HT031_005570 [Scenedesmus sp. PABB004]|nr:hypothetical protein HT031_005570 [Scenedesmus sp. PABB004]